MNEQEKIDWIQLINSDKVGAVAFYKLLNQYGSAAAALQALPPQKIFDRSLAQREFEKAQKLGISILFRGDENYPQSLLQLHDVPPVLYAKGRLDVLNHPNMIAIVGARNASVNGRKTASKIAYDLTQNDVVVVSGMARGIDAAAHKGALYAKEQRGTTIAVLGSGVDVPYPNENIDLYEQICEQGVVLSEFLLGSTPQANNFPRRNRLVAGLAAGTLVVEASLNSGSLITAHLALEQGKEVFAVPCSPVEGRGAGCNKLIREGAMLVENAEDILETLRFSQTRQIKAFEADLFTKPLDKAEKSADIPLQQPKDKTLADLITAEGVDVDDLIRQSGLSAADVLTQLTELEMDGAIVRKGSLLMLSPKKNRKSR